MSSGSGSRKRGRSRRTKPRVRGRDSVRRAVHGAVLAGLLVGSASGRVAACTCVSGSLRAHLERAAVAFTGAAGDPVLLGDGSLVIPFAVDRVYKGEAPTTAGVRTSAGSDGCGVPFSAGERYLVFARGVASELVTGLCDGTTQDADALERQGIRALSAPTSHREAPPPRELAAGGAPRSRAVPIGAAWALLSAVSVGFARAVRRPGMA